MLKDKLDDLKDFLENEDTKNEVVKNLNEAVSIPIISEKTEGKIISAIYDVFTGTIIKLIGD